MGVGHRDWRGQGPHIVHHTHISKGKQAKPLLWGLERGKPKSATRPPMLWQRVRSTENGWKE